MRPETLKTTENTRLALKRHDRCGLRILGPIPCDQKFTERLMLPLVEGWAVGPEHTIRKITMRTLNSRRRNGVVTMSFHGIWLRPPDVGQRPALVIPADKRL